MTTETTQTTGKTYATRGCHEVTYNRDNKITVDKTANSSKPSIRQLKKEYARYNHCHHRGDSRTLCRTASLPLYHRSVMQLQQLQEEKGRRKLLRKT